MAERFELEYVGADNSRHRPVMIHRALFGSIERFFGVLLEHYAGAFPAWLAPVQARVLPVRDDHHAYADRVADRLRAEGFRADVVDADEPLGGRIRKAKLEKLPYVLVVGDDDVDAGTVGRQPPRRRGRAGRRRRRLRRPAPRRGRSPYAEPADDRWSGCGPGGGRRTSAAHAAGTADADARPTAARCSPASSAPTCPTRRPASSTGASCASPSSTGSRTAPATCWCMPYREVADLADLTDDEHAELWSTVRDAVAAVQPPTRPTA